MKAIDKIAIKNFKSIKSAELSLGRLNLLAGLNGMGKSSLIQTLLLLKQSRNLENGRLDLADRELLNLGKSQDVYYQYGDDPYIQIGLTNGEDAFFNWNFRYELDREYLLAKEKYAMETLVETFNLFTDNYQYLQAERIGPRPTYLMNSFIIDNQRQVGDKGEFAVHYLNINGSREKVLNASLCHPKGKTNSLIHQTEAWLSEISPGTKINTTAVPGASMVLMDFQFETPTDFTNRFRPVNVGFGISYVLPVVVSLLMAQPDRLILIENPEAHLHPRGQAEMGRLMALAAQAGAQIIAETHSDHILNGTRVAVKNGDLLHDKVRIFFFDRFQNDHEQHSQITTVRVDRKGELSEYPSNFMDEWNNQLFKLI